MKKKILALFMATILCVSLCACTKSDQVKSVKDTVYPIVDSIINSDDMFKDRDLDYTYEQDEAIKINLADGKSKCSSENVTVNGDTVTVSKQGVYLVSGSLSNGQIIVDAGNDKVQLVLNDVSINCNTSSAIYCKQADKLYITSLGENFLSNTQDYIAIDDNNINAVIYSRDNLTLNGDGQLTINAKYGHSISSKDNLKITGGSYNITAQKHALDANDSVRITNSSLTLEAEKDGIHADNEDDETEGFVYVKDGTVNISSADDGIHASSALKIEGGSVNIAKSNEGLEGRYISLTGGEVSVISDDDGINATDGSDSLQTEQRMNGGMRKDGTATQSNNETTDSTDSLTDTAQVQCGISVSGGSHIINANGDGIDSNGELFVTGGTVIVHGPENSGNGAIDSNSAPQISGGTVVALGASGMAMGFSSESSQCSILYNLETTYEKGTEIVLENSKGKKVVGLTAEKSFNSVVISSGDIAIKNKYKLNIGDDSFDIKLKDTVFTQGADNKMGNDRKMQGNKDDNGFEGKRPNEDMPQDEMPKEN
ncbi:MAG: carbohydrate-binding domain-containing protein [Eubacterium sp.]